MAKRLCILGATGSIGLQTLDILKTNTQYQLYAFSANTNVKASLDIIKQFKPAICVMGDVQAAETLQAQVGNCKLNTEVLSGPDAIAMIAGLPDVDIVMAAIVGAAGLPGVLSATQAGKQVCLANKEALVMTGQLMMQLAKEHGAQVLPVDSEHNALFQCMPPGYRVGTKPTGVKGLLLTASGGPFLDTPLETFASLTPEQACKHPNWSMGAKISIDSATMMNKGLEVIEASFLFDMTANDIEVVIHPQSIIHSMVLYDDGSYLAQLGSPDMRIPISSALSWPNRIKNGASELDFTQLGNLSFRKPCLERFPALGLAFDALKEGGSAPCVLNAANEIAVQAFMDNQIRFDQISVVVAKSLESMPNEQLESIEQVLHYDNQARATATKFVQHLS